MKGISRAARGVGVKMQAFKAIKKGIKCVIDLLPVRAIVGGVNQFVNGNIGKPPHTKE